MGQKIHARSLLVFDMLQVVAFRFVCLFVLLQKYLICSRGLGRVQGGCMQWAECCMDRYENKLGLAGFGFSAPAAPVVPLPGYKVTSISVLLMWDALMPYQQH